MKKLSCFLLVLLIFTQTVFTVSAGEPSTTDDLRILSEKDLQNYFSKSVLVGDSVAYGYEKFAKTNKDSVISKMTFLTEGGFGASNATKSLDLELNPLYKGKRPYIWDSIAQIGAERVFLSYGLNDLVPLNKRIYTQYEDVVEKIIEKSPDISVHIVSITPVFHGGEYGRINNEYIDEVNEGLREMASENGWGFLDIASSLKDEDGNLDPAYCSDEFVHLNKTTYAAVWAPAFEQFAKDEFARNGYLTITDEVNVILTTAPCSLYTLPDTDTDALFTLPADTEIISEGITSNDMYLLNLGDGKDYFIETKYAKVQ